MLATLTTLRDAFARFDDEPVSFHDLRALVRRWIDAQTFAPRTGDAGVHVVDSASARFGEFDLVQLAGLVEGEWPDPPRRNIFYSPAVLRELGWPGEQERLQGARAAFADLVTLPAQRLVASAFLLEADTLVSPVAVRRGGGGRGAAAVEEPVSGAGSSTTRRWRRRRRVRTCSTTPRRRGPRYASASPPVRAAPIAARRAPSSRARSRSAPSSAISIARSSSSPPTS